MIAQRVAIAAPQKVLSLTSIMSSSGAKGLPQADPAVMRALISRPANNTPEAAVDHYVKLFKAIGSPSYPTPEDEMREHILQGVKRSFHPEGTLRQMLAIVSDITRAEQLSRITCPTLVLPSEPVAWILDALIPHLQAAEPRPSYIATAPAPLDPSAYQVLV